MYTSVRESCHVCPSRRLILEAINVGGDSAERPRCSPILLSRPSLLPARLLLARSYSIVALVTFNRFDRIEQHVYTGLAFNLAPSSRTVLLVCTWLPVHAYWPATSNLSAYSLVSLPFFSLLLLLPFHRCQSIQLLRVHLAICFLLSLRGWADFLFNTIQRRMRCNNRIL